MTRFSVQLPAGDTTILNLDLHTTTVAAVKAIVDARLESAWRASGVRILRSDLPFCGIRLRYQNIFLPMDEVLSSCKVRKGTTLYAEWPQNEEKKVRRKRYGKGWDDKARLETRVRGKKDAKQVERKVSREAAKKKNSKPADNSTRSVTETGVDGCVSADRSGDDNAGQEAGDRAAEPTGEGAQGSSEPTPDEGQDGHRAEEEEEGLRADDDDDDGPTTEPVVEPDDDPFADEDDDKENRAPVVEERPEEEDEAPSPPAEDWLVFDESNTGLGMDLMEEVLEF